MYKCLNCGEEFLEPKTENEKVPYGQQDVNMPEYLCCPFCGGDFEKETECEYCGKHFLKEESRMDVMCKDCMGDLEVRFSKMLNENFTKYEIKVLNVIYDGRNFG